MAAIDTLEVAKEMKAAGFTDGQAEALARAVGRIRSELDAEQASKADLKRLELALMAELKALEQATRADVKGLELALRAELRESKLRLEGKLAETRAGLLKWTMGAIGVQTVVIVGAVVALPRALGG